MKRSILIIMALALYCQSYAQNLLKFEWKFKTGDAPEWASENFNDSGWSLIQAGVLWENQGYLDYDGFAWYRQKVFVPLSLKSEAKKNGGMTLYLGKIDDADYTYWNGELLGRTGDLPPNYKGAYDTQRSYEIPFDKIKWGAENALAVRVYDAGGGGGIYGEKIGCYVKGIEELVEIKPVFERNDRLYLVPGDIKIPIHIVSHYKQKLSGSLTVKVVSDFGENIVSRSMDFSLQPGKSLQPVFTLGALDPGFYSIYTYLESSTDNKKIRFNIGVRPEEIVSPQDRPADFENYWQRARKELAAVDPQFRLLRQDSLCTQTREVFIVEMRSLGNILIRGWYIRPVKPGKYPAILHVQGYSTFLVPEWMYPGDDMVAFGLNIRGHGFSQDDINPGFPGYLLYFLNDKELYIYRGAYMDCIRAVDFLFSREEVDTTRVAVEGGSQGGALSFATAALDNERIACCAPQVPFLSDFQDYFKVAVWPASEFHEYMKGHPDIPPERVFETLSYIDIKNLASWIKAPVFMAVGLMDETCPPHINFAAYNQLKVPKKYMVYPESGHGLPSEFNAVKYEWIKKQFHMTMTE
jgi:cephalosporin-C deacetylase